MNLFRHRNMYSAPLNDGKWHHVCVTWDNVEGAWNFYVDGSRRISGSGLAVGHVIQGGGHFVIGQSQLSYGGTLDSSETFVGEISQLNLWRNVLQEPTLFSALNESCTYQAGDALDWRDFRENRANDLQIDASSQCLGNVRISFSSNKMIKYRATQTLELVI